MDVAPGASGHVRGGGALLDIPSQAAIHLELEPSRINMRARSFRPAVLEAQPGKHKKSVCGSQEKKCGSLALFPAPRAVDCRAVRRGTRPTA